jgi:aryl-alcohol dehydrogenase-like predicted oxidoreductase
MSATLGFGCVNLGSATAAMSPAEQTRLVAAALDRGVTVFDTADAYGNGASERILGRAVRGRRDDLTISTKGGYVFRPRSAVEQRARRLAWRAVEWRRGRGRPQSDPDGAASGGADPSGTATGLAPASSGGGSYDEQAFTPTHLRAAVEASLRRLGTDRIDVYQLHGPNERHDDLLAQLDDLRTAGTIGTFGIGAESLESATDWLDVPEIGLVFVAYGLLDPAAAEAVLPRARTEGRRVWARGVLGGGVLSAAERDPDRIAGHWKYPAIVELQRLAAEAGLGLDELAVGWVRRNPDVETIVLGIGSTRHLDRNVELFARPPLDDELVARIDEILARLLTSDRPGTDRNR